MVRFTPWFDLCGLPLSSAFWFSKIKQKKAKKQHGKNIGNEVGDFFFFGMA
jgi:hypothetical protein